MPESNTTLQNAEEHIICTARLHVSTLTTAWSTGFNRPLHPKHLSNLLHIFRQDGIQRTAKENRLRILCTPDQVDAITSTLPRAGDHTGQPLDFTSWRVRSDVEKLEVLAGQHRIAALRQYVKELGLSHTEEWWTCDLYNRGTDSFH
jgi:hypothetical protein